VFEGCYIVHMCQTRLCVKLRNLNVKSFVIIYYPCQIILNIFRIINRYLFVTVFNITT
jgi:hypothetical protein